MKKILYIFFLLCFSVRIFADVVGQTNATIVSAKNYAGPWGTAINPVVVSVPAGADHCHFTYVSGWLKTNPYSPTIPYGTFCIYANSALIAYSYQGRLGIPVIAGELMSLWTPDYNPGDNAGSITYRLIFTHGEYEEVCFLVFV